MRSPAFGLRCLLAVALCTAASLSIADVLKCRDATGAISYTDSVCDENTRVEHLVINGNLQSDAAMSATKEQDILRPTVWASKQFSLRSQPDVESIRIARLKVLSMDRDYSGQR